MYVSSTKGVLVLLVLLLLVCMCTHRDLPAYLHTHARIDMQIYVKYLNTLRSKKEKGRKTYGAVHGSSGSSTYL